MLPHQSIAYYRNDRYVTTLTDESFSTLALELAVHIRYEQLLIKGSKEGEEILQIPLLDGTIWRSTPIRRVQPAGNMLVMSSEKADYLLVCSGIDLERMLADGKDKGVNERPALIDSHSDIAPFPMPPGSAAA